MTPAPAPRSTVRRRALLAGLGATAALAGAGVAWWRQPRLAPLPDPAPTGPAAGATGAAGSGTAAPQGLDALWALTVARPEGGDLAFATLRGKPLLINFWATWCPPCVKEMPELDRFHQAWSPKGWQVVGLAIDGPTPVREFLAKVKVGFAIGLAGLDGATLMRTLGNPQGGLPFTVLLDAGGQIRQRKLGETRLDELQGWAAQI